MQRPGAALGGRRIRGLAGLPSYAPALQTTGSVQRSAKLQRVSLMRVREEVTLARRGNPLVHT